MNQTKEVVSENGYKNGHLAEESQQNPTEFALCRFDDETSKLVQCHQFVHCRDFMGDAMVGVEENKAMSIWGFTYGKDNPRPDMENVSILVRLHGDGLKHFQENLPILKDLEDAMGWQVTNAELVEYPDKKSVVVWVLGDRAWNNNGVVFSLYTYLLKCLTYPIKDKTKWMDEILAKGTKESKYMDKEYFQYLFTHMDEICKQYKNFSGYKNQKTTETYLIHNNIGFYSCKNMIMKGSSVGSEMNHCLAGWKK